MNNLSQPAMHRSISTLLFFTAGQGQDNDFRWRAELEEPGFEADLDLVRGEQSLLDESDPSCLVRRLPMNAERQLSRRILLLVYSLPSKRREGARLLRNGFAWIVDEMKEQRLRAVVASLLSDSGRFAEGVDMLTEHDAKEAPYGWKVNFAALRAFLMECSLGDCSDGQSVSTDRKCMFGDFDSPARREELRILLSCCPLSQRRYPVILTPFCSPKTYANMNVWRGLTRIGFGGRPDARQAYIDQWRPLPRAEWPTRRKVAVALILTGLGLFFAETVAHRFQH